MSNFISRGLKGVRKALHLPPITLGNVATKYGPAALSAATGNPVGSAAILYGGQAMPSTKTQGNPTFPSGGVRPFGGNSFTGQSMPDPTVTPSGAPAGDGGWMGTLEGILGGAGDIAKQAGSYVKNNPLDAGLIGLGAASAYNSAKASQRSGKLSDEAIAGARARWAAQSPLRAKAIAGLLNPPKSDLSSTYYDPTNPFATRPRPLAATPAAPASPTALPPGTNPVHPPPGTVLTPENPAPPRGVPVTGKIAPVKRRMIPLMS